MRNDWKEIKPRNAIGINITEEEMIILKNYFGYLPNLGEMEELVKKAWQEKIEELKKPRRLSGLSL